MGAIGSMLRRHRAEGHAAALDDIVAVFPMPSTDLPLGCPDTLRPLPGRQHFAVAGLSRRS